MTRGTLFLAGAALAMACGSSDITNPVPPPPVPPPPGPAVGLFGLVETEDGLPISGVMVELLDIGVAATLLATTATDDSGFFGFANVQGLFRLRIWKSTFVNQTVFPIVTGKQFMRIRLAPVPLSEVLILGAWISNTVEDAAPPCDPEGWDARAPCRRFYFLAPESGNLALHLVWVGQPELDIVVVSENGGRIAWSGAAGVDGARIGVPVVKGQGYEVRVNSYYGTQEFQLKADLVR